MGIRTAWQAIAQSPRRFLASSWPWRSLAYLLGGIAPSAAVAAGVLALTTSRSSPAAAVVLPPLALALLLSGPLVARYERWRLRLLEAGLDPDRRPAGGPGRRALERATASSAWSCCGCSTWPWSGSPCSSRPGSR